VKHIATVFPQTPWLDLVELGSSRTGEGKGKEEECEGKGH